MGPARVTWSSMCFPINSLISSRGGYYVTIIALHLGQRQWAPLLPLEREPPGQWPWMKMRESHTQSQQLFFPFLQLCPPCHGDPVWVGGATEARGGEDSPRLRTTGGLWWTPWKAGESFWLLEMKQISRSWRRWQSTEDNSPAAKAWSQSAPVLWGCM